MIGGILEIEIMNSIWNLQEQNEDANISVADVVDYLNRNNIERAYTTIKTVLDRLSSKDLLVRYKNNKKFFYRSTMDKAEVAKDTLNYVSRHFFNGSHLQMAKFIEKECEQMLV